MTQLQEVSFKTLLIPRLLETAFTLSLHGRLSLSPNRLLYLNIDNHYITTLYPLIKKYIPQIIKPNYFGRHSAGAHISVIYPEERVNIRDKDVGSLHHFKITGSYTALVGTKTYFVLGVEAPTLTQLRHQYGLSHKLTFKNCLIGLHITVGTS